MTSEIEDVIDVVVQVGTGGTVGFGEGGLKKGVTTKVVESTIKDITGASALEAANADAKQRFEEEKASRLKEREESKTRVAREQRTKSKLAAGARSGGGTTAGKGSQISKLGSDERDFLGL